MSKTLSNATARIWIGTTDPGLSETSVEQGNFWYTPGTGKWFFCANATAGIQSWIQMGLNGQAMTPASITFSGETTFNHYLEQQAWTPVVTGATTAGTGTYTSQNGYYTRIGNMIFLQLHVSWSAHTGTGNMTVTGLPFSARSSTNYDPEGIVNPVSIPLPGGATSARCSIASGASTITLYVLRSNNTNDPVQMNGSGELHVTITYLT